MQLTRALRLLLLAVLVVSPFIWASTADFFTEGIHDAESDNVLQAVVPPEAAIAHTPADALGHVPVVIGAIHALEESSPPAPPVEALKTRSPPLV